MTALWVILAVVVFGYGLSWWTTAPAARGVSASARLAEARRIAHAADAASARRRPVGQRTHTARGNAGRNGPRSRIVLCDAYSTRRVRHTPRP
jgi:hypothetical protein